MNLDQITQKLTSGDTPKYVLAGAGIIMVFLALKLVKGAFKLILFLVALALLGGAVWWHFHH